MPSIIRLNILTYELQNMRHNTETTQQYRRYQGNRRSTYTTNHLTISTNINPQNRTYNHMVEHHLDVHVV